MEHFLESIASSSELRIRCFIYVFFTVLTREIRWRSPFHNFTKWTILVVNMRVGFSKDLRSSTQVFMFNSAHHLSWCGSYKLIEKLKL